MKCKVGMAAFKLFHLWWSSVFSLLPTLAALLVST